MMQKFSFIFNLSFQNFRTTTFYHNTIWLIIQSKSFWRSKSIFSLNEIKAKKYKYHYSQIIRANTLHNGGKQASDQHFLKRKSWNLRIFSLEICK